MGRFVMLLGTVVLVAAVAGCASGHAPGVASPTNAPAGPDGLGAAVSLSSASSTGRVSDLEFTYPRGYYARPFVSCNAAVTGDRNGGCDRGVVIASYPLKPQPEIGGAGAHFSFRGVALELYRPPADNGVATVRLGSRRLSLWQFNSAGDAPVAPNKKPAAPNQWEAWFRVKGASYWAIAWVGNNAMEADRAALAALVHSVHARGQIPLPPSPKPPPAGLRISCGGTASSPRVPRNALAGGSGSNAYRICAQVSGHACRVWTRTIGAPPADVRERYLQLRAHFCNLARSFLRQHPSGSTVLPVRPGLTALLRPAKS